MPSVTRADTSRLLTVLALGSALWLSQGAVADGSPSAQIRTPEELEDYFNTHAPETADDDSGGEPDGSKAPADGEKSKRGRQPKPAATDEKPDGSKAPADGRKPGDPPTENDPPA